MKHLPDHTISLKRKIKSKIGTTKQLVEYYFYINNFCGGIDCDNVIFNSPFNKFFFQKIS